MVNVPLTVVRTLGLPRDLQVERRTTSGTWEPVASWPASRSFRVVDRTNGLYIRVRRVLYSLKARFVTWLLWKFRCLRADRVRKTVLDLSVGSVVLCLSMASLALRCLVVTIRWIWAHRPRPEPYRDPYAVEPPLGVITSARLNLEGKLVYDLPIGAIGRRVHDPYDPEFLNPGRLRGLD